MGLWCHFSSSTIGKLMREYHLSCSEEDYQHTEFMRIKDCQYTDHRISHSDPQIEVLTFTRYHRERKQSEFVNQSSVEESFTHNAEVYHAFLKLPKDPQSLILTHQTS